MYVDQQKDMYVACKISRPVVLLHVPLPGLGRERVEYLGSAQIFYSPSAQPRQQDMKENYRSVSNPSGKVLCMSPVHISRQSAQALIQLSHEHQAINCMNRSKQGSSFIMQETNLF